MKYWLGEFDRVQIWRRANREAGQLQGEIQENENQIGQVEEFLRALKDLPLKAATQARDTRSAHSVKRGACSSPWLQNMA